MCGLVGLISKETFFGKTARYDMFAELLWADTLRGFDSTGACLVDKDNNVFSYKRALPGPDFITTRQFRALSNKVDAQVMLGHNRAATRGVVTDDNAHPFRYGKVTLMHNGTIYNFKSLKDGDKFEVDSAYIAYSIDKYGVEETVRNINGGFALVWYDSVDKRVKIIKNKERTLNFGLMGKGATLIYSSEGELIPWIVERNKAELDEYYEPFEDGILYTIDPNKPDQMEQQKMELYKPPATNVTVTRTNHWNRQQHGQNNGSHQLPFSGQSRLTPSDALKKLGYSLYSEAYFRVLDIEGERSIEMEMLPPNNLPADAQVTCRAYLRDSYAGRSAEKWLASNTILKGILQGCRHDPRTQEYIVFVTDLIVSEDQEEKKPDEVVGLSDPQPNYEATLDDEEFGDRTDDLLVYPGPRHEWISKKEFLRLCQDGCDNCQSSIDVNDAFNVVFTHSGKPICPTCIKDFKDENINHGWADM